MSNNNPKIQSIIEWKTDTEEEKAWQCVKKIPPFSLVLEIHPPQPCDDDNNETTTSHYFYLVLKNEEGLRKPGLILFLKTYFKACYEAVSQLTGVRIVQRSLSPSWEKEASFQCAIALHDTIVNLLLRMTTDKVETIPVRIQNILAIPFNKRVDETEEELASHIGPDFYQQLYDYQKEGVRYCITRLGRGFIADEMGLGKTFQALAVFNYFCSRLNLSRNLNPPESKVLVTTASTTSDDEAFRKNRKRKKKETAATAAAAGGGDEMEGAAQKKSKSNNVVVMIPKGRHHRLLVICPSSVKENWCQCLREKSQHLLLPQPPSTTDENKKNNSNKNSSSQQQKSTECKIAQRIDKGHQELLGEALVMTFSLAAVPTMSKLLLQSTFDCVIVDESHNIKSSDAKRTKILLKLCAKAQYCLLLSGTPLSRPKEIWTQVQALQPKLFPLFWHYPKGRWDKNRPLSDFYFAVRYCDPKPQFIHGNKRPPVYVFNGSQHSQELFTVLRHCVMTRHMKNSIAMQLPSKTRERIIVDRISGKEEVEFKAKLEKIASIKEECGNLRGNSLFMDLWHQNSDAKIPKMIEYWKSVIEPQLCENPEQKIVIFAHHQKMLDALEEAILTLTGKRSLGYMRIDGGVASDKRKSYEQQFQTDTTTRVALLSICAAGTGITLTKATHLYFAELYWSPEYHLQAEDRIHRVGQQYPVTIQYLMIAGSTDDILWSLVCSKARTAGQVLDNRPNHLKSNLATAITCSETTI